MALNSFQTHETEPCDSATFFPVDQLINGIIHNINNPLTILKVRTQLLLSKFPQNAALSAILENTGRIESILGNLATKLKEEQNSAPRPLSLNAMINIELRYLEADLFFKHHVIKNIYLQESLPVIRAVYHSISQGFLALVAAAITNMHDSPQKIITIRTYNSTEGCELEISDTGTFLPSNMIAAINNFLKVPNARKSSIRAIAQHPISNILYQSYRHLQPYISQFEINPNLPVGMQCQISFPTKNKG